MVKMSPQQFMAEHQMLCTDPQKYLDLTNERIVANPTDSALYFDRYSAWEQLGKLDFALTDLESSLQIEEKAMVRLVRGEVLFRLNRIPEALSDFRRAEPLDGQLWGEFGGPLYEAECHLRLGNGAAALAACSRIPNNYFSPGLYGVARGNKSEINQDISWRISAARG